MKGHYIVDCTPLALTFDLSDHSRLTSSRHVVLAVFIMGDLQLPTCQRADKTTLTRLLQRLVLI